MENVVCDCKSSQNLKAIHNYLIELISLISLFATAKVVKI